MGDTVATDHAGLEVLTPSMCEDLLAATPIGRVGFTHDGEQFILPVNYCWRNQTIVFCTAPGHKLASALDYDDVAFEVDRWNDDDRSGWSVLVRGGVEIVDDEDELLDLEHSGLQPWANTVDKPFWVRIVPQEITGRRIPS